MKLVKDLKISFDIENRIFTIHNEVRRMGKITGHALPNLLGYDNFNSRGATILGRFGLTEFEPIDPIYTLRGELSEQLALDFLISEYKKYGVNLETKTFPSRYKGSNGVWYGNDLFKKNERFGGVIDIGIVAPQEFRAVVEVKSKSLFNDKGFNVYESIFPINKEPNIPKSELWQGLHYACLMTLEKLIMVYVFWTNEQMKMLRPILNDPKFDINEIDAKKILNSLHFTHEQFTIRPVKYEVDLFDVSEKQERAYNILKSAFETKQLEQMLFTKEESEQLEKIASRK